MIKIKSVCVFCGSSTGKGDQYLKLARNVGKTFAQSRIKLIYGGASAGCMGAVADGALENGGEVMGILPQILKDKELAHKGLTKLKIIQTLAERKELMIEESDAFLSIPGGFGTMDEFFEVLTWNQLGLIQKPIALLNHKGFYDSLIQFLNEMKKLEFIRPGNLKLFTIHPNIQSILNEWSCK